MGLQKKLSRLEYESFMRGAKAFQKALLWALKEMEKDGPDRIFTTSELVAIVQELPVSALH